MCHYVIRMQSRGQASVYRIVKSPFQGFTYTPYLGNITSEMPTQELFNEFERLRTEHQEKLYSDIRRSMEARERAQEERLEQASRPRVSMDELKERAMLILPQVVNLNTGAGSDTSLINCNELRRILNLPHNKAYMLRGLLLRELHANDNRLLNELRANRD